MDTAGRQSHGELPTREQYEDFQHRITTHTMVHEDIKSLTASRAPRTHARALLGGLRAVHVRPDSLDLFNKEHVDISTIRLLAKAPTLAAYAHTEVRGRAAA
ncbi:citrate/2-methylcitrate synthase [Kocuria rhizophila]|nr:citrate/2-methylcitrate synthase [Kocuria rhizophila]